MGVWLGMVSLNRKRGVDTTQIVCLSETKSGEDEVDDIRNSGRGVE